MKIILFSFLLICNLTFAQNQRFVYEYQFVIDSTKKSEISKELMHLDITKAGSKFYSRDTYIADSIMFADFEKQMKGSSFDGGHIKISQNKGKGAVVRYKVLKSYPDYKVTFQNNIGMDKYNVNDIRKVEWKISSETKKIGDYSVQKATGDFAGRTWIAWFCSDIPFQDGPYKFHGLPGLIIDLVDTTDSHHFLLKAVTKFIETEEKPTLFSEREAIEVNQEKYTKLFMNYRKNGMNRAQMFGGAELVKITDANGKEMSMAEMEKKQELMRKESIKRNNNLLELDMLLNDKEK